MGSVICDMQAPDGDDSLLIEAEVDRGTSVDEVDETNNIASILVPIGDAINDETKSDDDDSIDISQNTIYVTAAILIVSIIAIFIAFAPPKIKKLE